MGTKCLMTEHTTASGVTRAAEKAAAGKSHEADRPATDDEATMAEANSVKPGVAAHEREMLERGANQRGEGRIG